MEKFTGSKPKNNSNRSDYFNSISFKKSLNKEQLNVINNINGPMIVIAGAGSGKTRTITYSVAKLLKNGIKPSNIMLVTFTNKSANEMLERIEKLLGKKPKGIWGGTFHSIANRVIRLYTQYTGLQPRYSIVDQADALSLMRLSIKNIFPNWKLMNLPNAKQCYKILSYQINCNKSLKQVLDWKYPHLSPNIVPNLKKLFKKYSELKIQNNVVDFDDLLVIWNKILDEKDIAEKIAEEVKFVLIDEYQDTNFLQAEIIFKIAKLNNNIMVVGDDAQSIYGFRGSNFKNLLNFNKNFKNVKKYEITSNYRSTPEILDLANDSIKHNEIQFQKKMTPIRQNYKKPIWIIINDDKEQADYIVNEILRFQKNSTPLSKIAVLYRSNYNSLRLQQELQANGIPFEVRSGVSFFEQSHIKDIISHLKIIHNPRNQLAWNRIFSIIPGIGSVNAKKILDNITSFKNPLKELTNINIFHSKLNEIKISKKAKNNIIQYLNKIKKFNLKSKPALMLETINNLITSHLKEKFENYEERLKDINAIKDFALEFNSIGEFLDKLNLITPELSQNIDLMSKMENKTKVERLILSTIHKAKGLEWDNVFIISLCESLFPSQKNSKTKSDIEEERRIFYVALTRSRNRLYLLTPKSLQPYKGKNLLKPSRFITELNVSSYEVIDFSNNLYEESKFQFVQELSKKNNSKRQKKSYLPQFISADKLIKNKD